MCVSTSLCPALYFERQIYKTLEAHAPSGGARYYSWRKRARVAVAVAVVVELLLFLL